MGTKTQTREKKKEKILGAGGRTTKNPKYKQPSENSQGHLKEP